MDNQETSRRILETIGINDSHIDLVGRVLDLEKDTKMIHSVSLTHGTIGYHGLYAEVLLFKQFPSDKKLAQYLQTKGISIEDIHTTGDRRSYFFYNGGIKVGFVKPDFYPEKG